ncbi:hypothetical protein [Paenibacillus bouchesdurhonensis]|uniref:hypothetical protein n=1 Tax=Paenibacillus bouchesdurhonensis TaxID=1870990 RepID=UPI00190002D2|nr:hypothetical protein [Paenibacillus bouchesdurhonensis]
MVMIVFCGKFYKSITACALSLGLLLSTSPTFALGTENLTPEQLEVINSAKQVRTSITKKSDSLNTRISTSAVSSVSSYSFKLTRGSFLAWSDAIVDWTANSTQITSSDAHQKSGYVFPNIVRTNGITKQKSSAASYHIYLSETTIGAGVVTPWGDVTVYETDFSDYLKVYKDGSATNY